MDCPQVPALPDGKPKSRGVNAMESIVQPQLPPSAYAHGDCCCICFETFGSRDVAVVEGRCGHRYDLDCITRWFDFLQSRRLADRACVYCRRPTLPLTMLTDHVDDSNPYLENRLLVLARLGKLNELKLACAKYPTAHKLRFLLKADGSCMTLLTAAAECGHLDIVRFLVARGADVKRSSIDARQRVSGRIALMAAAENGHCEVVKYLLDNDPWVKNARHRPDGSSDVLTSFKEICLLLLGFGPCVNAATISGDTPLIIAAKAGHPEVLRLLLNNGANVCAETWDGRTALMEAARRGCKDSVLLLRQFGSNSNQRDIFGRTPLIFAVENGHLDCIKLLIKLGASVNSHRRNGHTPLMIAAENGNTEVVSALLRHGARVGPRVFINACRNQLTIDDIKHVGFNALMLAIEKQHLDIARLLIRHGACVDTELRYKSGADACWSTLKWAIENGDLEKTRLLLDFGANINIRVTERGNKEMTALMLAVEKGDREIVCLLIKYGASINAPLTSGHTALTTAAQNGDTDIAHLLLRLGARINDRGGRIALMIAAQNGHLDIVRLLLSCGAKVNPRRIGGFNAQMLAIERKYPDIARLLHSYHVFA